MAPVLTGVWWGPEAGVVGIGSVAAAAEGGAVADMLGGGQLVLVVTLSTLATLLLVSVMLLLCTSCHGQKKAAIGHSACDRVDLMDGTSDKETVSQSPDSPMTDVGVSSSHYEPPTSGTILTDTQASSPHPSEEIAFSQSEHRSSKCHQDRELPSLPPNSSLIRGTAPPSSGDSTYEVVKDMAVTSRDISIEDSLYETVKELKYPPKKLALTNGTADLSAAHHQPPICAPLLLNGHLSPSTAEYASVDHNKKSRHSADLEAKQRSGDNSGSGSTPSGNSTEEPEDLPPPVPEKVLDENDNQPMLVNGFADGEALYNGKLHSPLSSAPGLHNKVPSDNESPDYSSVNKKNGAGVNPEDKEHDYSSIAELKGLIPTGSSGDLYATVHDVYAQPGEKPCAAGGADPGYESIRIPKNGSLDEEGAKAEPDYESVGELGLSRETSRL
ncbi:phosphoprotein associated with glycosphingolipid-enriched microdomains 1 isoform X1 [Nerophis ophidion]|uniref:phosphoprotein associated with glycosphingolipid-enriched microdomains 1 isoform X1 n=1 Tax=Nerophis ophidion TaxID=159077 RepID=UPI002ADF9429|nr:phosphoprotein associated with glycosphingolipid-enriched microdomains 1 isoform X1 [Nerophis ophidion]XP_061764479.1 phosphoprotein associated with glycosphingolipid-enriched microdomains 1 isoform X1 [Nerophis ophidion]XP_061764480.1 phosphoprotein associated with glycosphingolipid-enriched microdomains 1 isoform X1 [Nerophis ophidion]